MERSFEHYDESRRDYEQRWALIDETLHDLCRRYPGHSRKDHIYAKLLLIGRSFNTGLERGLRSKGGMGGGIETVGDHLYHHRGSVEAIFRRLERLGGPLSADKLRVAVAQHGRFNRLLMEVTRKKRSLRSFASKYMHFHCPAVPIYDSVSAGRIRGLVPWRDSLLDEFGGRVEGADDLYQWHVCRFWKLFSDLERARKIVNVRLVDVFLLWGA